MVSIIFLLNHNVLHLDFITFYFIFEIKIKLHYSSLSFPCFKQFHIPYLALFQIHDFFFLLIVATFIYAASSFLYRTYDFITTNVSKSHPKWLSFISCKLDLNKINFKAMGWRGWGRTGMARNVDEWQSICPAHASSWIRPPEPRKLKELEKLEINLLYKKILLHSSSSHCPHWVFAHVLPRVWKCTFFIWRELLQSFTQQPPASLLFHASNLSSLNPHSIGVTVFVTWNCSLLAQSQAETMKDLGIAIVFKGDELGSWELAGLDLTKAKA